MSHIEQHQYLKDKAFVEAERDFLFWQEWNEEMEASKHQKPAKIVVQELIPEKELEDDLLF